MLRELLTWAAGWLPATKKDIMALREQLDTVLAHQQDNDVAVDGLAASLNTVVSGVQNLTGDVANLKKQIDDLQNSPGAITPEDQERLNNIQNAANALNTKTRTAAEAAAQAATAIQALADATPDTPPVEPPVEPTPTP